MLRKRHIFEHLIAAFVLALSASSTVAGEFSGEDAITASELASDHSRIAQSVASPTADAGYVEGPCDGEILRFEHNRTPYGWATSIRCFYDASGALHHWVYEVASDDYKHISQGKPKINHVYTTAFSFIRDKQRAYNAWVQAHLIPIADNDRGRHLPHFFWGTRLCAEAVDVAMTDWAEFGCGPERNGMGSPESIPYSIPLNGRLTLHTLLIPYYQSLYEYDLNESFLYAACDAAGTPFCTNKDWRANGARFYPNAFLAQWGQALDDLKSARDNLFRRVIGYSDSFPIKRGKARVDCVGAQHYSYSEDINDCALELDTLPAGELEILNGLTTAIADKTLIVQSFAPAESR